MIVLDRVTINTRLAIVDLGGGFKVLGTDGRRRIHRLGLLMEVPCLLIVGALFIS